jgi:hypothetical protein
MWTAIMIVAIVAGTGATSYHSQLKAFFIGHCPYKKAGCDCGKICTRHSHCNLGDHQ